MKRISALALLIALAACTRGPDFTPPEAPKTASYLAADEALPHGQRVAVGKQLQREWWRLFASAPLDDAIATAIDHNPGIVAAQESLAAAQEAVRAEEGTLQPQVALAAAVPRQKYGAAMFGPSDFAIPPFTAYEVGASASWTPDIFGGGKRRVEQRQAFADYSARQLDAAYVSLTGNVVAAAVDIATAKAGIAAVESIISDDRKTLDLTRKSYAAGAGTKVDILAAQSQLDSDTTLLPPLKQRMSVARHSLAVLTSHAPADEAAPPFKLDAFALPKEIPLRLPSELARSRPDILAAEANLHAASAAIGVAEANLYPSLTLSANVMQEALTPAGLFKSAATAWAIAANATMPVMNDTLSAEKRAVEHNYKQALAVYQQTILNAFGQVADSLSALTHDAEDVAAHRRAVETARSSLDLARKSYEAGNISLLQVQDAQRLLGHARLGLTEAQGRQYLDTARLFVALGGSPVT